MTQPATTLREALCVREETRPQADTAPPAQHRLLSEQPHQATTAETRHSGINHVAICSPIVPVLDSHDISDHSQF
jgi:hypothetical protein